MMTEKCVNVAPLLRFGSAQSERLRFHTAGLTQSDNEVPALCGNGLFDLFIVVAAICNRLCELHELMRLRERSIKHLQPFFTLKNATGDIICCDWVDFYTN